jgi:enamine deaminase RidA (YjgF/YER057c/UK114 family)
VSYAALHARLAAAPPLAAVAFGERPPQGFGGIWVNMPALGGEGYCEIWEAADAVERVDTPEVSGARTRDVFFGALQIASIDDPEVAGRLAYNSVFETIAALGYPHLWRAWNYFPDINGDAGGVERYRLFNIGRHDAFEAFGRTKESEMPAASALGCRAGPLTVYFIAGREPGTPVENPRQISAYRYPERYGPRSPTFSRAMLMPESGGGALAISGTASITGHETQHIGDPAGQIEETLANVRALIDAAGYATTPSPLAGAGLLLKAYLRSPDYVGMVEAAVERRFASASVICLQADICRSELLVEVEGVYRPDSSIRRR